MSGGNDQTKVVQDNARLEQPSDAVPMEFLPPAGTAASQVPASTAVDSSTGDKQHIAVESTSTPNISSARADSSNQNSVGDEVSPAAVSKGKGKQEATPLPTTKERSDSILAIGPAQDDIMAAPGHSEGPVCNITLLLTSGSRHPYKIDAKYLTRRNVAIPEKDSQGQPDPFSISIYTLKELILREWRSDWETKPASPSSIRLIHFGKLLDDKEQLESKHRSFVIHGGFESTHDIV